MQSPRSSQMVVYDTKEPTIYMYLDDMYTCTCVSQIVQDSLFSLKKYSSYKYILRVNFRPNKSTLPV